MILGGRHARLSGKSLVCPIFTSWGRLLMMKIVVIVGRVGGLSIEAHDDDDYVIQHSALE